MALKFARVGYTALNSRQQEAYNFQKVSAVLADYGFTTIRLASDWRGADFIAQHLDGLTFLKVQLKGRCCFDKKYTGRDLHICFPSGNEWFLYPHDELLGAVLRETNIGETVSWKKNGGYSFQRCRSSYEACWSRSALPQRKLAVYHPREARIGQQWITEQTPNKA